MLITEEMLACAKAVDLKHSSDMMRYVLFKDNKAMSTTGKIAVVAEYEPEMDEPERHIMINAENLLLLEKIKKPIEMEVTEERITLKAGTVTDCPQEPETSMPGIQQYVTPAQSNNGFKVRFSRLTLERLVKSLKGAIDDSMGIEFRFDGPHKTVFWEASPINEAGRIYGVVMPMKDKNEPAAQ
jgi:hypothetical protein